MEKINSEWVGAGISIVLVMWVLFSLKLAVMCYLSYGFMVLMVEQEWTKPWLIFGWLPWCLWGKK